MLSASALTFLGALVRADWAVVIVLLIAVIVLGSTFLIVWKANHKSRFAAITPKGIVVRNLGSLTHIPFEEISLVATNDIVPWIQKRDGQRISLRGIVANSQERRLFKEAAASDRADKNTESGRQKIQKTPATDRPRKSTPLRLTYVGVSILAVAIIGMLVFGFGLGTKVDADSLVGAAVAVFWGGVVIALVGQWRSDKQTSKPEPSSKKKE
ncbi:MAG: hypothetical protein MI923_10535 [Phycisphaerales bacterium]|nr:hypothetical protein [Phycisphaerales bacterium]